MTAPSVPPKLTGWEREGRRQALLLDGCSAAVVIGDDPVHAAHAALGLARVQSQHRHVLVVDAVGLLAPIDDLVPFEERRGLPDVILNGVPINEVACPLNEPGNLSVLNSGPAYFDRNKLFHSSRWSALAEEYRAAHQLMIIVAAAREPALHGLLRLMDGVVLVGTVHEPGGTRVIAYVRDPRHRPRPTNSSEPPSVEVSLPHLSKRKPQSRPGALKRVTSNVVARPERRTRPLAVKLFVLALAAEWGWWYFKHHWR